MKYLRKTTGEDLKEEVSDVVDISKDYTVEQWDKMNAEINESFTTFQKEMDVKRNSLK